MIIVRDGPFIFKRNIALRRPFYDKAIFLWLPKGNNFEQVCQCKCYQPSVGGYSGALVTCMNIALPAPFYRIGIVTSNDDKVI